MTPKRLVLLGVAVLFGAEVWAFMTPEKGDTISEIVWWMNDRNIPIAAVLFYIMGHWFWPRRWS